MRLMRVFILLVLCSAGTLYAAPASSWHVQLFDFLTTPNWAYLLLLLGVYGIFFEVMNPGMLLPGVVGLVALFAAIYGLHLLPVTLLGVFLLVIGLLLMLLESFIKSFGISAIAGVIAFVFGSFYLFDGQRLSLAVIIAATLVSAAFFLFVIRLAVRSQRKPVVTGGEELLGARARVVDVNSSRTLVRLHGELWQAQADESLKVGEQVEVIGRKGLVLTVKREQNER